MAKFLLKTKNEQSIKDKPRVYFTCHPDDFAPYFEKICKDIFKSHDCAIYYTENMSEDIPENERETDIGRANLMVVPVTFKLLTKPCRAMQVDVAYAKKNSIRILPLMMETGINEFYKRPENFGERQYLSPFANDLTEIGYEEKLKKYLDSSLLSDEMMNRIRRAFDAYIFLSYRKKDRAYANELMKMIHRHPECRDIAIWYDEFLTPGESFKENIARALEKSKLFALLVTPNLLEEPNFVKDVEYPEAKKAGKDILPVEMEDTDRAQLEEKYEDIPACADPTDDENFKFLLNSALKIATSENDNDPEHNFLIGLAYVEGIDVEVDTEKGLELITSAAEAELPEAMEWLYNEYTDGRFINYSQALVWAQKCVDFYTCKYGEESALTLEALIRLATSYRNMGNHTKAFELSQKCYALRCKVLGEEHPDTLTSLYVLANAHEKLGNYAKALELQKKCYESRCKILGDGHPDILRNLHSVAELYLNIKDDDRAFIASEICYERHCKIFGDEHRYTLIALNTLANFYYTSGIYTKAFKLYKKCLDLRCKTLGEEHPDTLESLASLAKYYFDTENYKEALKYCEKCYGIRCKVWGADHPDTLQSQELIDTIKFLTDLSDQ